MEVVSRASDSLISLKASYHHRQYYKLIKPTHFLLGIHASKYVLGAVLLQGRKEDEHLIEYPGRLLLPVERNYSTNEREALAVVWAVQKFHGYIKG